MRIALKSTNWKTVAELIGIAAIVVSLVFVGVQLEQDRDLAQVSSFGSMTESANALSELVQAHSEIWVKGLDGETLTDSEKAIFMSLVRAVEARYMNFIIRWQATSDERFDFEIHVRNFAYYIYMYPGLRKAIQDQARISKYRAAAFAERSTDPPLIEMALQYVKVLDDAAPDIPITKTYIIW